MERKGEREKGRDALHDVWDEEAEMCAKCRIWFLILRHCLLMFNFKRKEKKITLRRARTQFFAVKREGR